MKVVIIGGVAAGLKTAAKLKRCNPEAQVTVVERGSIISYGACGMPYFISGDVKDIDQLRMTGSGNLRDQTYFRKVKGFEVLTRTLATRIDRQEKTVAVRNLATDEDYLLPYDKLVLAVGASPVKPPIPGIEKKNIFTLWHPDDAVAVQELAANGQVKNAVIIGAGLVGMEMAEALHRCGLAVTVIEMRDRVFPAFLDADTAGYPAKYLAERGITVLTSEKVEAFYGEEMVSEVKTDQRILPAELVILAAGVKPNVELARAAGLQLGVTGAIAVNESLQTSDPDIYAGGDCVENTHIITGKKVFAPMGSTANKHGRVIGEHLCGLDVRFRGVLNTVIVKVLDLFVGKVGLTEQEANDAGFACIAVTVAGLDKPHYMPGSKLITIKLIADSQTGKVLGAQLFGEGDVAKRVDVLATLLTFGGTISDLFDIDLGYAPPFSSPIDNVAVAANALMNKLSGKLKGISSLQAKEKLQDKQVIFLDVRSPEEHRQVRLGKCQDVRHIPLGQLRERIVELPKDSEIIAFCKISQRGFEAECMLENAGFQNVKILEGGLASWPYCCEQGDEKTSQK